MSNSVGFVTQQPFQESSYILSDQKTSFIAKMTKIARSFFSSLKENSYFFLEMFKRYTFKKVYPFQGFFLNICKIFHNAFPGNSQQNVSSFRDSIGSKVLKAPPEESKKKQSTVSKVLKASPEGSKKKQSTVSKVLKAPKKESQLRFSKCRSTFKVCTCAFSIIFILVGGLFATIDKPQRLRIRNHYNSQINNEVCHDFYLDQARKIHNQKQCIGKNLACAVSDRRDDIKIGAQKKSDLHAQVTIFGRQFWKYCTVKPFKKEGFKGMFRNMWQCISEPRKRANPTCKDFLRWGYSPEKIFYKAMQTDGRDLGVKGNACGNKVHIWESFTNKREGIFPKYTEDMSDAFTTCMMDGFQKMKQNKTLFNSRFLACNGSVANS